jgi:SNF2 family DNA or RNA helicase
MSSTRALRVLWPSFSYKPHQIVGVNWMMDREKNRQAPGGIVCDEMGLGKTIETLGLLKNQPLRPDGHGQRSLLVGPVAVLEQWAATAERAGIQVWRPHKTEPVWLPRLGGDGGQVSRFRPQLYLIGYELARIRPSLLFDVKWTWDRVVYDEAHRLGGKNQNAVVASLLPADARWFLTATPIVNGMGDLHTLLELLGYEETRRLSQEELSEVIYECILGRTMDQLRASIPDAPPRPVIHRHTIEFLTVEEEAFYNGIQGILSRRFRAIAADGGGGNALERLQLIMRLRQLSLHPQVYIEMRKKQLGAAYNRPDWVGTSTKFNKIRLLLEAERDGEHRWIIFCHFHEEMERLRAELSQLDFVNHIGIYSGASTAKEREAVLDASREPMPAGKTANILMIQLQAGGVGLNLQHCDRIMFTGPWWTSALMEQAVGRAVRIGQREVVQVHHLLLKAEEETALNIDRLMMEKAVAKGELCREVLSMANDTVTVS